MLDEVDTLHVKENTYSKVELLCYIYRMTMLGFQRLSVL
jgi:hypothetical protein